MEVKESQVDGKSKDLVAENIEKLKGLFTEELKELFPQIVVEDKVNFDQLKNLLGEYVDDTSNENYVFKWYGKSQSFKNSQRRVTSTLRFCEEDSKNVDTTENLYIEGDNLEVLKLLQKSYFNSVKMIYIDPPYNLNKDFIYSDKWNDSIKAYKIMTGQMDDDGNTLDTEQDKDGGRHSKWLSMMYPRLLLARNLLKKDGVIFISIDDIEVTNLSKLCDDVFGAENHIGTMTIQSNPRGSQASNHLSNVHEYIVMYAKDSLSLNLKGINKSQDNLNEYSEVDGEGKKYRLLGLRQRGGEWKKEDRPLMHYPIFINPLNGDVSLNQSTDFNVKVIPQRPTGELSRWTWGKEKFEKESSLIVGKRVNRAGIDEAWDIFRKDYLLDDNGVEKKAKVKTIWEEKETNYQNAKNEIKALFGNSELFDFPKPTYLVSKLLSMLNNDDNDVYLDFFSGSGTTAHAVMQLNAEDGGNRKYICVQIPENLENSYNNSSGTTKTQLKISIDFLESINKPKNICEIGKERIRRAGEKIKEEIEQSNLQLKLGEEPIEIPDIGFKVLKLDTSNFKRWNLDIDEVFNNMSTAEQDAYLSEQLDLKSQNIENDRTEIDLVYEVMQKFGVKLCRKVNTLVLANTNVYEIGDGALFICLDTKLTTDLAIAIIEKVKEIQPDVVRVVVRDLGFVKDSHKTDFRATLTTGIRTYFKESPGKSDMFEYVTI